MKRNTRYGTIRLLFFLVFLILLITQRFQLWLIIYLTGVVLSLFFGRIYCGYVCPMNTVMRHTQRVSRKIGLQRKSYPSWLESTRLPYLVLIISAASMIIGMRILQRNIPVLLILFLLSNIVTLLVSSQVWHNGLCPYSILLRLAATFSKRSRKVDLKTCVGCGKCLSVCPAGAISTIEGSKKVHIDRTRCHQCEACTAVCPTKAISYPQGRPCCMMKMVPETTRR